MSTASDPTRLLPPEPPGDGSAKPADGTRNPLFLSGLQLLDLLGEGGFGSVYRAVDDRLGRVVAVKVLRHAARPGDRERFMAEAVVTGNLQHPNILPVHNLGTNPNGQDFFSMPVVQGRTLGDVLRLLREGDRDTTEEFPLPRLVAMLVAICEAVAYAHARKVVHRDLKPANIMTGRFGEVFVLDWGLAKMVGAETTDSDVKPDSERGLGPITTDTGLTLNGMVVGTPGYMAPEQASGQVDRVSYPADVYSLGVLLYEMITLHRPPKEDGVSAMLSASPSGSRRRMRVKAGKRPVPRELQAVTAKCLAHDPAKRYPDAAAMVKDLHAWLADRELSVHPDSRITKMKRWLRRHRTTAAVGLATLASATIAAFVLLVLTNGHARERARLAESEQKSSEQARQAAEAARISAERATQVEHAERERLDRHTRALGEYLPGLSLLERAQWNPVRTPEALEAFDRALDVDPSLIEAHRGRGAALTLAGRFEDAIAAYQRALTLTQARLGHEDPELLRLIGDLYWERFDDFKTAADFFRRAARTDPANPHARIASAIVRSMDGDMAGAIADLRTLAVEAPDWYEVHEILGLLLLGQGPRDTVDVLDQTKHRDSAGAEQALSEAIRLRSGYHQLYLNRCIARLLQFLDDRQRTDLRDGFVADSDSAVLLAPGDIDAHRLRLQVHQQFGSKAVAIAEAEALGRLAPHHLGALSDRAIVLTLVGRGAEVLKDVEGALVEQPGDAGLLRLHKQLKAGGIVGEPGAEEVDRR